MKNIKHAPVFTVTYCTSIVVMLILLHGCAATRHTQTTPSVVTTETLTIVEQRVKNPETGDYEMKIVSKERTKTTKRTKRTKTQSD